MKNDYIVLPTVDGDPGDTYKNSRFSIMKDMKWIYDEKNCYSQYKKAVECYLELFSELNLEGKITWFLNERDTGWTKHFSDLIKIMVKRGDNIALHTHVGTVYQKVALTDEELRSKAYEIMKLTKDSLEKVINSKVTIHRFGCYFQDQYLYSIIKKLGINILSDVVPGVYLKDLEGHILDNENIPINAEPWKHDEYNWMDYNSKSGFFTHIPVAACSIGEDTLLNAQQKILNGRQLKNIDVIDNISKKSKKYGIKIICWDIHPNEIQLMDGNIDYKKLRLLKSCLLNIQKELSPVYMNFNELYKYLNL
ncbi:MAG: hypothetical protein M1308_05340 [Actinobacteria bacterium]|nr:hypothetical protein [Actinomycetota bacterium]